MCSLNCAKKCEIQGGGQEMTTNGKSFNNNSLGEFVLPSPSKMWRRQHKFTFGEGNTNSSEFNHNNIKFKIIQFSYIESQSSDWLLS